MCTPLAIRESIMTIEEEAPREQTFIPDEIDCEELEKLVLTTGTSRTHKLSIERSEEYQVIQLQLRFHYAQCTLFFARLILLGSSAYPTDKHMHKAL
jgi:hypothetical protein